MDAMALTVGRGPYGGLDRRVIATTAKTADRAVENIRRALSRQLDRVQLQLRVVEVRSDPHIHAWADEMRRAARDGSLAEMARSQPTVDEIVDSWHLSKSS